MTVKDEKGRILTSNNPVLIGTWKKAGYEEVAAAGKEPDNTDGTENERDGSDEARSEPEKPVTTRKRKKE